MTTNPLYYECKSPMVACHGFLHLLLGVYFRKEFFEIGK
jgi:hypothetical protein